MIPELFKIGPITINSFGVMAMLAFLVPTFLLRKEVERIGQHPDLANSLAIAAMIGGFLGARIYYILERWASFLENPMDYIFTGAGLVWYGGLAGGFLAATWYVHRKKISVSLICDVMAPLLALGQTFGRMGCLLSGDGDYGPPTDVPWAMTYPKGIISTLANENPRLVELYHERFPGQAVPADIPVHPTPIYDMIILLSIFAFLWTIRKKELPQGFKFGLYLTLIGGGRIFTEFYRTTPKVFLGLTVAQLISVGLIVIGGGLMIYLTRKNRMQKGESASQSKKEKVEA
jgi:phosphatidylglycerol:prolipoprotein diacylglycerol transferase